MNRIGIELNGNLFHFQHAENYNELTPEQFRTVVKLFILKKDELPERFDDKIEILQSLLTKTKITKGKNIKFKIIQSLVDEGVLDELLKLQAFLSEKQDFNNWIIDKIKIGSNVLYGPKSKFSYMQFGEFIVVDMLFMSYFKTEKEIILDKFIAVLYRERDNNFKNESNGDCRVNFDSQFIDARAKVIANLDHISKQAILFNYAGVRYWLTKVYPYVFGENKNKDNKNIEFGNNRTGWMEIRRNLAGDVFNLEKTDKLLLSDVMKDLNEKIKEK